MENQTKEIYLQIFKDTDGVEKVIMNNLSNKKMIEVALNLLDAVKKDFDKSNPASKVSFSMFCMRLGSAYDKITKKAE